MYRSQKQITIEFATIITTQTVVGNKIQQKQYETMHLNSAEEKTK